MQRKPSSISATLTKVLVRRGCMRLKSGFEEFYKNEPFEEGKKGSAGNH